MGEGDRRRTGDGDRLLFGEGDLPLRGDGDRPLRGEGDRPLLGEGDLPLPEFRLFLGGVTDLEGDLLYLFLLTGDFERDV